jgi:heat shock protein HslJ
MDHDMSAVRVIAVAVVLACAATACGWDDDVDSRVATEGLPSLQQDLEAHEWVLDGPSSTPVIDAGDRSVTIAFEEDTVHGRGPCNTYRGRVSIGDEESIEFGVLAVTQIACEDSLMRAERAYFDALAAVSSADVDNDDDRLTLEGDGVELRYRAIDVDELLVGEWEIVNVATEDAIVSTVAGTEPTVTFHENGDLRLVTGCNDGSSSWELDGNELTIDPVRQTLRFCAEPNGVMEQEAALAAALEATARVEVTPESLTLLRRNGTILLVANKNSEEG